LIERITCTMVAHIVVMD